MDEVLIAPCGINCNICPAHLRKNKRCPGCYSCGLEKLKNKRKKYSWADDW